METKMEEMKTKEENMLAEEKEREVGREKMQRRKEGKQTRVSCAM